MIGRLPRRVGSDAPRDPATQLTRLDHLARHTRSATELITASYARPVITQLLRGQLLASRPGFELLHGAPGDHHPAAIDHLLIDTAPTFVSLGIQTAIVLTDRLPAAIRAAVTRGEEILDAALSRDGAIWSCELLRTQRTTAGKASYPFDCAAGRPLLRLTRRLSIVGLEIAVVVDEVLVPDLLQEAPERSRPP